LKGEKMGIPFIRITGSEETNNGITTCTITGYLHQCSNDSWVEGVNDTIFLTYSANLVFIESEPGKEAKRFLLDVVCNDLLFFVAHRVYTVVYVVQGDMNYVVDYFYSDPEDGIKTELSEMPEDFFLTDYQDQIGQ
jgi:hypothetical protein